jgi:hypothetical protein
MSSIVIGVKNPFKRMMCNKEIFARPWPLNCEESIAPTICEEYLVQHMA